MLLIFVFFCNSVWASPAAQDKPLYELGVGAGIFYVPHYPASNEQQTRYLGLPYFVYRGRIFKADDDGGMRGEFLRGENYRFDLSASAAFSSDSSENEARRGMPDLDWIGELGPRWVYYLMRSSKYGHLDFNLSLRQVFSTDFKVFVDRGEVIQPNVAYSRRNIVGDWMDLFAKVSYFWASERLQDYFYEVPQVYATAIRPAYDAKSGFMEFQIDFALGVHLSKFWRLFFGASHNFYHGTANAISPLHKANNTTSVGLGLLWTLHCSAQKTGQ